jgi:hypothetical protein
MTMSSAQQLSFLDPPDTRARVADYVKVVLKDERQPLARELVAELDRVIGIVARWDLESVLASLLADKNLTHAGRAYLTSLPEGDDLVAALRGEDAPDQEAISTIDVLLDASGRYRNSPDFREMIEFIGRFRQYAPYNNMLVRVQNPSCGFYVTAKDWREHFERAIKEDVRPMLILAPMHPVILVYDLDQMHGKEVPKELLRFAQFKGQWEPSWLERLVENARCRRIRIDFKNLSSTNAGFARFANPKAGEKMRIAIHADLPEPSQFGVLCHEMVHILLGHLSSDEDHWRSSRSDLGGEPIEIEAEATAYIVTQHLNGASAAYVSRYLGDRAEVPKGVSFDMIGKAAGQIEKIASSLQPAPLTKAERAQRRSQ